MGISLFFNSVNGDRRYKAESFADYFAQILTNGIFPNPSSNLQVTSNNDMTITIKPGRANIKGYFYLANAEERFTMEVANPIADRYDLLVLRWDLLERKIYPIVKKDTLILTRNEEIWELGIAEIAIKKGTASITQADIKDIRQDSEKCGWVDSLIRVDSTTLFNQFTDGFKIKQSEFENQFLDWFDTIKSELGEDIAGNLQNQINKNKEEIIRLDGRIVLIKNVTIAVSEWLPDSTTGLWMYEYTNNLIKSETVVNMNIELNSLEKAGSLKPVTESYDGYMKIYSENKPLVDIFADLQLIK